MSIIGSLGNLFGYKGDFAEAFGSSIVEASTSTFADGIDKSLNKFDKRVDDYDKIELATDIKKGELQQKELKDAVNGIKKYTQIGFSPAIAAAIHVSPVATQKIIIDAANSTEDKTTLDSLWTSSVEINKEMPTISIMDAAKLLVGNQIKTERDYSNIPETKNMLTRLGINANLKEELKKRAASRPTTVLDLSVDTDATIPTGGPTSDALAKSKSLNAKSILPREPKLESELIKLDRISYKGSLPNASSLDVINGLESDMLSTRLQITSAASKGQYIADAMIKNNVRMRSNPSFVTKDNPSGLTIFANKNFIKSVKDTNIAVENETNEEKQNALKSRLKDIFKKIQTVYGNEAVKQLANLIK